MDIMARIEKVSDALVEHHWLLEPLEESTLEQPLFRVWAETSCGVLVNVLGKTSDPGGANIDEVEELLDWLKKEIELTEVTHH